jgi:hypothetical protein
VTNRDQDVHTAVAALSGEGSLEQRLAEIESLPGQPEGFSQVSDALANLDALWEQILGQAADRVPLIEDRLGLGIGRRDFVFGVVGVPEQLGALKSRQELGLRQIRCASTVRCRRRQIPFMLLVLTRSGWALLCHMAAMPTSCLVKATDRRCRRLEPRRSCYPG